MKLTYPISVRLLSALHINGGTGINGMRITVRNDGHAYIPATIPVPNSNTKPVAVPTDKNNHYNNE